MSKYQMKESQNAPDSAFSVHGIWTPGIILMRNIKFQAKVVIIMAVFLIPIIMASHFLFKNLNGQIEFRGNEVIGVELLDEVMPINEKIVSLKHLQIKDVIAQGNRDFSKEIAEIKNKIEALKEKNTLNKEKMDFTLEIQNLENSLKQTVSENKDIEVDLVVSKYEDLIANQQALIDAVLDRSNLILDPDIDTYYLMDGAGMRIPKIIFAISNVNDISYISENIPINRKLSETLNKGNFLSVYSKEQLDVAIRKIKQELPTFNLGANTQDLMKKLDELKRVSSEESIDVKKVESLVSELNSNLNNMEQEMLAKLKELLVERTEALEAQRVFSMIVIGSSLLVACYLFFTFFLVTRGGLRIISQHLNEMAEGNLQKAPYKPWGKDEPSQVIIDLRKTYEAMFLLVQNMSESANQLLDSSKEISSASLDLSNRTEESASSLEQQSSALKNLSESITETTNKTDETNQFAKQNSKAAEKSGEVINNVIIKMDSIKESSRKISEIISVIDTISFQTNILALNAAVEAARAGEQGRGFAVVAAEVRNLAQKTSSSAQEIKKLIDESGSRVNEGVAIVENANQSITVLLNNAKKINALLDDIAENTKIQKNEVVQISQGVSHLEGNIQQNAALVEETSASANVLHGKAQDLMEQVAKFKI